MFIEIPIINIAISVSASVLADMKKMISVFYRYWPIRKLYLSACIGIGRYEKKLIGCSLPSTTILILFYNTHHQEFIFPNFKCVIAVSYCISILNKNLPFLDLYYKTQLVGALYAIYSNNSGPLLYF